MEIPVRTRGDGITLEVRLTPRASREEIAGVADGKVLAKVSQPPLEGKANKALISLISRILKVPKSRVRIIKGESSRNKVVSVSGIERREAERLLGECLG